MVLVGPELKIRKNLRLQLLKLIKHAHVGKPSRLLQVASDERPHWAINIALCRLVVIVDALCLTVRVVHQV